MKTKIQKINEKYKGKTGKVKKALYIDVQLWAKLEKESAKTGDTFSGIINTMLDDRYNALLEEFENMVSKDF